mgnify:CR=1 FL=1
MSKEFWLELSQSISSDYKVKWQEGFDDINKYINWIDSLETLVTLDSLGTHIGISLNKNVIFLFGPTNANDIHIYNRGKKIITNNMDNSKIIEQVLKKI